MTGRNIRHLFLLLCLEEYQKPAVLKGEDNRNVLFSENAKKTPGNQRKPGVGGQERINSAGFEAEREFFRRD